ncbi:ribosome biogenesis protein WDR12 homolog [Amborella trichopoda]|uniref:Ribosome biogenesis protein WDR12 homolog n=1 Tax=Amborella trichopoda TaxID=13333 RepID=W1PXZ7_AMBTC|nr:ribosome biogenesis protein WDR12 homolog [Amborella trichopoda]XP_011625683.1 ribosome biogenesis protein WDR12 homolog [Amborella trichopoda]XP_011625684.1 ribosome biogenesis protein WDR12 homolog [Amborella trichopoda]XP_011625685.1 ribosome biogenesis protein WDR12 homolog [Amborella trichopoda]XP_011625686.1 ribosome biogenesis protein WDR12 homolog [Amborella trichopoda]XP_020526962.1 ribosome biogenesis protein WDR12 homolog [Amborella trichopoda]ERN12335.1 hypothetical protein AMT|eukprot:XP_006850754.1 ribosome biogenesis protein WDR12 homolog [Amborella trichopoda]
MEIDGGEAARQVRVRFITKLPHTLRVSSASITLPSDVTRAQLSNVVNTLLNTGEHEVFDFIVDGELVRVPLEKILIAKGISAEKVLDIEYFRAVAPRRQQEPELHEDWVSAVDGSNPSVILTGCYDSFGRLWNSSRLCTHILEGHTDAITSVCIINSKADESNDSFHVTTASKDRTLRLWKCDATDGPYPRRIRAVKVLREHTSAVQSVSAGPFGNMVCSGSWDCSIKLWQSDYPNMEGDSVLIKKRKMDNNAAAREEALSEEGAISTFLGHTQCVSCIVWPEQETIYSASWDHSIRMWDVEIGKDTVNMVGGKAWNCLDVGGESSALIAAGGSDPVLRIWDPRRPGKLDPVYNFASHRSWITACKWHPRSWFHLVSSSHDGKVMLWDLRAQFPLAVIDSHKDKVLCADWWNGDSVISGGADGKLCISSEICIP